MIELGKSREGGKLDVGRVLDFNKDADWTTVSTGRGGLLRYSVGDDVLGFTRALGRPWESINALREGHSNEGRDTISKIRRREDYSAAASLGEQWVQIGAPVIRAPYQRDSLESGILIEEISGYWAPGRLSLTSDGQEITLAKKPDKRTPPKLVEEMIIYHAKTVGREKAELAMTNPDYDLVKGTFMPNWSSKEYRGGGGRADFTYFWDRTSGELTLVRVGSQDLRGRTGPDPEYIIQENDGNFAIRPFGRFVVPARLSETTLAYNLNYPERIPLFNPKGGLPDWSTPRERFSYNLFDIRQIQTQAELEPK